MKTPKTKQEIANEIAALKLLKPIGCFEEKTQASIELQIETLEYGFDDTSEEWNELTEEQQSLVTETQDWKDGYSHAQPSKQWGGLVA